MRLQKKIYMVLILLLTVCSIVTMLYFMKSIHIAEIQGGSNATGLQDNKYMGYIFDDYNKNVNLSYSEETPDNEDDIINAVSLSAVDMEYTADNMRAIRSERLIEEKARLDEILGRQ